MATSTAAAAKTPGEGARLVTKPTISLNQHIQALPQELQDEIKEMLILSPGHIEITRDYKPPLGLQLDHKTRERFAKTFYKAHFVYDAKNVIGLDYHMLDKWLLNISAAHCLLIQKIEIVVEEAVEADKLWQLFGYASGRAGWDAFLQDERTWLQNRYRYGGPEYLTRAIVFAMRLTVMQADGTAKELCCP